MDLPLILASRIANDEAIHELGLSADLIAFRGHFPGRPILPGVAQIDWAARLAAQTWGVAGVARNFRVKFRSIIAPGAPLTLVLRYDRARSQLHFEYRSAEQVKSSGRIDVEPAR